MISELKSSRNLLIILLLFAAATRLFNINYPNSYVFDEVYHAFTAKEYLKSSKEAWEWWTNPPPGVAYEWTHPPLAKEIMAASMFITKSTDAWAWRLPGVMLGVISVYLIYLIAVHLFKNQNIGLLSAFIFSIDGLNFVQSRVGMNDIYFVASMLATLLLVVKKKYFWSAIFLGLSLSSKWSAFYLFPFVILITLFNKDYKKIPYFFLIPAILYLMTYIPFFLLGHSFETFTELQKQMWWYHTGLKASHDYTSPWWTWPLNLYPVWYYVDYHKNDYVSNIFASGIPLVFWSGASGILLSIEEFIRTRSKSLAIILIGFFIFWLPWALSPRIMFLYHFAPSIPFLSLALGYQLNHLTKKRSEKIMLGVLLLLFLINFLVFYPILVGIGLPKDIMLLFFETNITKNPF